ncbi:MAG: hypothetical protein BJ554DRAFT_5234, partial [Olpidium bornovanus]
MLPTLSVSFQPQATFGWRLPERLHFIMVRLPLLHNFQLAEVITFGSEFVHSRELFPLCQDAEHILVELEIADDLGTPAREHAAVSDATRPGPTRERVELELCLDAQACGQERVPCHELDGPPGHLRGGDARPEGHVA